MAEREGVELAEGCAEVGLRPLGHLLEGGLVLRVERDREGGVEETLAPALHLVAEAGDVLKCDLGFGGHGAATAQGERLSGLEAHLLPLQGAGGLLGGYGAEVDGEVHGRACGHQALEESGGEGRGASGRDGANGRDARRRGSRAGLP